MMLAAEHYRRRQLLKVFAVFGHSKSSIPIDRVCQGRDTRTPKSRQDYTVQCYC